MRWINPIKVLMDTAWVSRLITVTDDGNCLSVQPSIKKKRPEGLLLRRLSPYNDNITLPKQHPQHIYTHRIYEVSNCRHNINNVQLLCVSVSLSCCSCVTVILMMMMSQPLFALSSHGISNFRTRYVEMELGCSLLIFVRVL